MNQSKTKLLELVKTLRAKLRYEKRWSKALLFMAMGDPLPPALEKEFGKILDKL